VWSATQSTPPAAPAQRVTSTDSLDEGEAPLRTLPSLDHPHTDMTVQPREYRCY